MNKYLTRAIKYFIFLMVLVTLVVVLMILFGFVGTDINSIFRGGYNSVWQIALIFLVIALIYPRIGFGSRTFTIRAKDWDEARSHVFMCMGEHSYKLESDNGKTLTFRKKLIFSKLAKFLEDRITIERVDEKSEEVPDDQLLSDMARDLRTEKGDVLGETVQAGVVPNKYLVSIEGLTKDVLRIVSGLYGIQNRNTDE